MASLTNRSAAGRALAEALGRMLDRDRERERDLERTHERELDLDRTLDRTVDHRAETNRIVLGLVRGGTFVAVQIAHQLRARLDVLIVRDLKVSSQRIGVLVEGCAPQLDPTLVIRSGLTAESVASAIELEAAEIDRCMLLFRGRRQHPNLWGSTAIVVDDGSASAQAVRAGLQRVRALGAERVVLAVPIVARSTFPELAEVADEIVFLDLQDSAIRLPYADDQPIHDEAVLAQLARARLGIARGVTGDAGGVTGRTRA